MSNKKVVTLLSFLLIFALVLQFLPLKSVNFDGVNSYAHDSKEIINAVVHSSTVAILNNSNRQNLLKVPATRVHLFYEALFFSSLYCEKFSINKEYVINTRKKIKNILYSHFNGTKYKENTFII